MVCLTAIIQHPLVTDRHTDKVPWHIPRYTIWSHSVMNLTPTTKTSSPGLCSLYDKDAKDILSCCYAKSIFAKKYLTAECFFRHTLWRSATDRPRATFSVVCKPSVMQSCSNCCRKIINFIFYASCAYRRRI